MEQEDLLGCFLLFLQPVLTLDRHLKPLQLEKNDNQEFRLSLMRVILPKQRHKSKTAQVLPRSYRSLDQVEERLSMVALAPTTEEECCRFFLLTF